MEHLVTSRELSEKLAKAGVKQESKFYWILIGDKNGKPWWVIDRYDETMDSKREMYSAYLAGELGEMLPVEIEDNYLKIHHYRYGWRISYGNLNPKDGEIEANARGLMLLWLIENGHMDVENGGKKMKNWKKYQKKQLQEMRPYIPCELLEGVSISQADKDNGSPKEGDMIARNANDPNDMWLVAKKFFEENYQEA